MAFESCFMTIDGAVNVYELLIPMLYNVEEGIHNLPGSKNQINNIDTVIAASVALTLISLTSRYLVSLEQGKGKVGRQGSNPERHEAKFRNELENAMSQFRSNLLSGL